MLIARNAPSTSPLVRYPTFSLFYRTGSFPSQLGATSLIWNIQSSSITNGAGVCRRNGVWYHGIRHERGLEYRPEPRGTV